MKTIDLDQLDSVTGGRLFGAPGGLIRPAGFGGGLFGTRQARLAARAGSACGPAGCGAGAGAAPASGG